MLAVLLPVATMSAETPAAMLYTTNAVTLNGVAAARSSAVFSGDTIQTPADSAVTITAQGSTVLVGPSSLLVYQDDAVRLGSGTTLITTEKGMKAQIQKLLVTPASEGRASYRVIRGRGKVMVAALRGSVKLSDGTSASTLPEGSTATIADPDPAPQAQAPVGGGSTVTKGNAAALGIGLGVGVLIGFLVWETSKEPVSGQ
jgi:hypothetical protein